jgi:hypothetical protein
MSAGQCEDEAALLQAGPGIADGRGQMEGMGARSGEGGQEDQSDELGTEGGDLRSLFL